MRSGVKPFQTTGAAWQNAQLQQTVLAIRTSRRLCELDLSSLTGLCIDISSVRYDGLFVVNTLNVNTAIDHFISSWLVFKAMHGLALDYIAAMCRPVSSVEARRCLRPAADGDLIVSASHTVFGERAFFIAAPRTWNNLPAGIRSSFLSVYSNMLWKLFCLTGLMAKQLVCQCGWVG